MKHFRSRTPLSPYPENRPMWLIFLSVIVSLSLCPQLVRADLAPPSLPISLDVGFFGGLSWPGDELMRHTDPRGWNAGLKARIHRAVQTLNIVGSVTYNRISDRPAYEVAAFGVPFESGEADVTWMVGGGLEYAIPIPIVSPYLGFDALLNQLTNTKAGASAVTRGGLGIGGGLAVAIPLVGTIDGSVKYQVFNIVGRSTGEPSFSQVAVSVGMMFSIL